MRDFVLLGFVISTPTLAVLGHDIYKAYNNTELTGTDRFYLSDLGWLWTEYHPKTYNWVMENTDAVIWNSTIDPLLEQSALYVALAPFLLFISILLFMKIFGLGPYEGEGLSIFKNTKLNKKGEFSFRRNETAKRTKYKRK